MVSLESLKKVLRISCLILLVLSFLVCGSSCAGSQYDFPKTTHVPPVRRSFKGAPGQAKKGTGRFLLGTHVAGEKPFGVSQRLDLALGLNDVVALELGGGVSSAGGMGTIGTRFTRHPREDGSGFAFDLGITGGFGEGGVVCNNNSNPYYSPRPEYSYRRYEACPSDERWDRNEWWERLAGGFVVDAGIAYYMKPKTAIYVRPVFAMSLAEGVPATYWYWGYIGPQKLWNPKSRRVLSIHGGMGPGYYHNELDSSRFVAAELVFSIRFL